VQAQGVGFGEHGVKGEGEGSRVSFFVRHEEFRALRRVCQMPAKKMQRMEREMPESCSRKSLSIKNAAENYAAVLARSFAPQ
jgi:hypothetical protein